MYILPLKISGTENLIIVTNQVDVYDYLPQVLITRRTSYSSFGLFDFFNHLLRQEIRFSNCQHIPKKKGVTIIIRFRQDRLTEENAREESRQHALGFVNIGL